MALDEALLNGIVKEKFLLRFVFTAGTHQPYQLGISKRWRRKLNIEAVKEPGD